MPKEINSNKDGDIKYIAFPYFKLAFIFTVILCFIIPSRLKLNKMIFFIGIAISILITNLLFTYYKVLYYDNSWYTQEYHYNKSHAYDQGIKDIINETTKGINYYTKKSYNTDQNTLYSDNEIKKDKNYLGCIYESIKYIFTTIGEKIKYIFYGESKANYVPMRKNNS